MKFCSFFHLFPQDDGVVEIVVVAGTKNGIDQGTTEYKNLASTADGVIVPMKNSEMPAYYYKKGLNNILKAMCPF